jgi:hypothetical protein
MKERFWQEEKSQTEQSLEMLEKRLKPTLMLWVNSMSFFEQV